MVSELYEALLAAGIDEGRAKSAAMRVVAHEDLLEFRADLRELRQAIKTDLAEQKAELLKWHVGTLVAITAIYGGLVTLLKVFG
jgi:hypothetical protein